jgi:hypothetical protein
VANAAIDSSRDWLASARTSILAWWAPHAAMLAALVLAVPARAAVWIVALVWMGTACIVNARRCHRTHCRYTGPYYLAMIAPVLAFGSGIVSAQIGAESPPQSASFRLRTACVVLSGPTSWPVSIANSSTRRVRARLTRLLMVPTALPQICAASS